MQNKDARLLNPEGVPRKISRSTKDKSLYILAIVAGVGGIGLLIQAFLMFMTVLGDHSTSSMVGYYIGGITALVIVSLFLFRWAIKTGKKTEKSLREALSEVVAMLKSPEIEKRRWAAKELTRVNWLTWYTANQDEYLDYLAASENWDLLSSSPQGVAKICQNLILDGISIPSMLKALSRSKNLLAVGPLIDFLEHGNSSMYREDIVKALREISGKDFGTNLDAWRNWCKSATAPSSEAKSPNGS